MSGKGSEVGINFNQLAYLIGKLANDRIKICLDTCHLWDAGYNIKNYEEFKAELIKYDLLRHVSVIHLNDSKWPKFT
ncbi:putative endonuclease 4 [Mycoplasmopsis caviae]|uniref:Putative endonuclease 4 n=1 Tax=Mycoplasmopsis caviae TaxID=55603 RepID=A0A3P8ME42_9BACT|nr:putative endonuclease 4 [Mycoplasmopsis caviae]